jgi:hypothetical protein
MSKLISIFGAPGSGKSVLASDVNTELKKKGLNSIYITEAATDYIAEYGVPNNPMDQMVIFYKQLNRERMFIGNKDYIICDSSSILNYFYFRGLFKHQIESKDIAAINHLQKEILRNINSWNSIFYIPPMEMDPKDGIRFHDQKEINKIDRWIKSYLEMENIHHFDLSKISIKDRTDYIIKKIL